MSSEQPQRLLPQLAMTRPLEGLEPVALPDGCRIDQYRPGLAPAWEDICARAFGARREGYFTSHMRKDYAYRPERVLFAFEGDAPVATASAWYKPEWGRDAGYLHMVAVAPEAGGKRLGYGVSLACLHRMANEGRAHAVLETDDFRLAALKTYLRMGFVPRLVDENQRDRWRAILDTLAWPERFDEILMGPLAPPEQPREDQDKYENYEDRWVWLPGRPHRGIRRGDPDFLADEALYRPSQLGTAAFSPARVTAGAPVGEPICIRYTAGPAGLHEGQAVHVVVQGLMPFGFWLLAGKPGTPGNMTLEGPGGVELEPARLGFRVVAGRLEEGDSVTMTVADPAGLAWTKLAARIEMQVALLPGPDEPEMRLPAPMVLDVLPRDAVRIEATAPCTRAPEQPLSVHVTARDEFDNRVPLSGAVELAWDGGSAETYMARGMADATLPADVDDAVAVRLDGTALETRCNRSLVRDGLQMYVGDLHVHDFLSEAMGWPDNVYQWAVEDRNLDFASVVPQSHGWHDNQGWTTAKYMAERFLDEGRFVTFPGFEWQHTGYGDKVVHYLGGAQPLLPMDDRRYNTPARLYEALRQSDALIISHHPAYPVGSWCANTDYAATENDVERLTEIWSMHGSAEGYDENDRPYVRGLHHEPSLVMNALKRGVRVGFVGGSDTHGGRPGGSAAEPRPYWGGLAAVWAKSLTRRDVFEALYARRTVALTRERIVLWVTVNDAPMGSEIPAADTARVQVEVQGTGPLERVELMKNAECLKRVDTSGETFQEVFEDVTGGPAFYHVRVTQADGHLAVCSPVWVG